MLASGLAADRGWALVNLQTGKVASAKQPRLWRSLLQLRAEYHGGDGPADAAGAVTITLPDGTAVRAGEPGTDEVLSEFAGRPVALRHGRQPGTGIDRAVPEEVLAHGVGADVAFESLELSQQAPGDSFVDYAPVHLITTATLAAVDQRGRHGTRPVGVPPQPDPGHPGAEWLRREQLGRPAAGHWRPGPAGDLPAHPAVCRADARPRSTTPVIRRCCASWPGATASPSRASACRPAPASTPGSSAPAGSGPVTRYALAPQPRARQAAGHEDPPSGTAEAVPGPVRLRWRSRYR